jgi:hypothetical protein
MMKLVLSLFLVFFGVSARARASDSFDYRSLIIEMTNSLVQDQAITPREAIASVAYYDLLSEDNEELAIRVGQDALYYEDMETNTIQKPEEAAIFFKKLAAHYK